MQRLAGCPRTAAEDESRSAEGKLPLGSKIKAHNNGFAQQASVLETTKLEELRLEPATSSKVSLHPSLVDWFKGCPSKGIYIYIFIQWLTLVNVSLSTLSKLSSFSV